MKLIAKFSLLTIVSLLIFNNSFAQNTIHLLNGKRIPAVQYQINNTDKIIFYEFQNKKGNSFTRDFDLDEIFGVTSIDGTEKIFYTQTEDAFSVEDMRGVLNGQYYAVTDYKPYWAFATSFVVGAGVMFTQYPFYLLSVPILLNVGASFIGPSDRYISKHYPDLCQDDLFVYGYKRSGRSKVLKHSVVGTVIGVGVGLITNMIIDDSMNN